jgi:hypothetical protein
MRLKKIIRYLEVIDRQLEILYFNYSKMFLKDNNYSEFWKEISQEKSNFYSCLFLIEQVGEENMDLSEYKESEFVFIMQKLTQFINETLDDSLSFQTSLDRAVEIETEHYTNIYSSLTSLVKGDFKQVVKEMSSNGNFRKRLKEIVQKHYPEPAQKEILLTKLKQG